MSESLIGRTRNMISEPRPEEDRRTAYSAKPRLQSKKESLSLLSSSLAVIPLSQTGLLGTLSLSLHFPCFSFTSFSSWDDSRYGLGSEELEEEGA